MVPAETGHMPKQVSYPDVGLRIFKDLLSEPVRSGRPMAHG